jgi:hypothetical protein
MAGRPQTAFETESSKAALDPKPLILKWFCFSQSQKGVHQIEVETHKKLFLLNLTL